MTTLLRVLFVAACLTVNVLAAAPAVAQESPAETEARSVFAAGGVAFRDGRYADALGYFKRAFELSHRPALLFNIALCEDRLRDDEAAIADYERYIAAMPTAPNRREVDDRLQALRGARERRQAAAAAAVQPTHVAQAAGALTPPHEQSVTETPVTERRAATESNRPARVGPSSRPVRTGGELTADSTRPADTAGGSIIESWWLWTIVGVVVVGGGIGLGVALSGGTTLEAPLVPPGGLVMALGGP